LSTSQISPGKSDVVATVDGAADVSLHDATHARRRSAATELTRLTGAERCEDFTAPEDSPD
jgi:hypothetical protein